MLFLCNSLDSHPTIILKPNGSFCRPTTLHFNFLSPFLFTKYTVWSEYYFVRIKRPTVSTFKITTACNGLEALRMADVCVQIPSTFSEGLVYHRDCYQKFTMNLRSLPAPPPSIAGSSDFESRHRRSLDPDKIIFRPDCIFCEYLLLQDGWHCASQANRSTPLILVSR
jgi:hypothetical protein